ncbi:cobaltochelatase CobT-related protein [Solidesulfovibrio alcoholivorans]|uniref:cobaltochelatase CobT-related protein n=1 Tax=Solidesulfovibrio alcoholivorans TaxID=81406 RepID=UPI0004965425|nr:VWA domain-containing protein [Solidesulfovibrio alcoholivorans]
MGTMRHVLRSLPLLAAVLGDAYGVSVVMGGKDAHTDGKVICLPSLPAEGEETLLPLVRGLIDHEAAHIRETDFDALAAWPSTPFSRHIWNSLEDWRVENKLGDLFPGCRHNFRWLIAYYFADEEDRAGDNTPALSVLNAILLTVRSWDAPEVSANRDKAVATIEACLPGLWPLVQEILDRVRAACRSTQDAITFAEEIVAVLRKEAQAVASGNAMPKGSDNGLKSVAQEEEAEAGADKEESEDPVEDMVDEALAPEQNVPVAAASQEEEEVQGQAGVVQKSLLEALDAPLEGDWPLHLGEQLAQTLCANAVDAPDLALAVARRGDKPGQPFGASELEACLQASVAMRTRLYRLLQAHRLVRCQSGRRGRLDTKRLHRVLTGDGRVFAAWGQKVAVHTAVHVLLDSSGSMSGEPLRLAAMACYAVALALERIKGINVAVSTFPAGSAHDGVTVAPLIEHGQRVHAHLDILAEGYTPLAQVLWWVLQQMVLLKEDRKMIVIVTDGEPDSVPAAQRVLGTAHTLGFEVYGIGIQSAAIQALLPRSSVGVKSLSELPEAMFTLLHKALAQRPAGGRP